MHLPAPLDRLDPDARKHTTLTAGDSLFLQNTPTKGLFFLEYGSLELRRFTSGGDTIVLHRIMPGETFAEASLFTAQYHCEIVATTASRVLELDREAVLDRFASDNEFAMMLTARFAAQIQSYRRRFEIIAIRSAKDRVHAALSDGMLTGNIKSFAGEIGLSHEAVYRALSQLVRLKRIKKTARGQYKLITSDSSQGAQHSSGAGI